MRRYMPSSNSSRHLISASVDSRITHEYIHISFIYSCLFCILDIKHFCADDLRTWNDYIKYQGYGNVHVNDDI